MATRRKSSQTRDENDNSHYHMFANLFLLFFGSGTFSVPWGFARAGLFGGIIGVFSVAFITYATIRMLVKAKKLQMKRLPATLGLNREDLQHTLSYAAIATHAMGTPKAGLVVKTATTLSTVGACGGYLIFVVGLLLPMFQRIQNVEGINIIDQLSEKSAMIWLLPILIPLTWIRSFKGLAYVSAFGNIVFISSVAVVLYDGFSRFGLPSHEDFIEEGGYLRLWPDSAASYTLFISPCIFLFTVHYCALPIEAEGDRPTYSPTSSPSSPVSIPQTPLSSSLRFPFGAASSQNSHISSPSPSTASNSYSSSKFDTALFFAVICSAILNATLGACSYVLFGRANHPPQTSNGVVAGCDTEKPYMCDNVVKNLSPGPMEAMVSIALILNIAIGYVLMLAPSRQYIEAAALGSLASWFPATFSSNHSRFHRLTPPSANNESIAPSALDEEEEDSGVWVDGADNWARAWVRNIVRTLLVLFTAQVALTIPHFALITGLIGGLTDSLQSLVLPPMIYICETIKSITFQNSKAGIDKSAQTSTPLFAMNKLSKEYAAVKSQDVRNDPIEEGNEDDNQSGEFDITNESSQQINLSPLYDTYMKLEVALCSVLVLFGICFILFATASNIKAIQKFL